MTHGDNNCRCLRPMQVEDVPAVMDIETEAYTHPWTEGIFKDCLRVGYCSWICVDEGRLLGYVVMSVAVGEAHILNICVKKSEQGKGFGRRILRHVLRVAAEHDADTCLLEVRPSNGPAVHLYEDLGFNEVGRRKDYYPTQDQGKEDALIFAKAL